MIDDPGLPAPISPDFGDRGNVSFNEDSGSGPTLGEDSGNQPVTR